jgi:hypothetical protein
MSVFQSPLRSGRVVSANRSFGSDGIVLVKGIIAESSRAGYFYLQLDPSKELLFEKEMGDALWNSEDSRTNRDKEIFLATFYGIWADMDRVASIDLSHYGKVILSGHGTEPSLDAKKYMMETFGFE